RHADGTPAAFFVHDAALLEEPELLESVAAATRLAIQRSRLEWELRARLVELERERDFVRDAVNAAPAFFAVLDLEGRIIRFNDALERSSGIVDDDAVRDRPFADVFAGAADRADVQRLIVERAPGRHEHRWVGPGETELVIEWSTIPIEDAQARPRLLLT